MYQFDSIANCMAKTARNFFSPQFIKYAGN